MVDSVFEVDVGKKLYHRRGAILIESVSHVIARLFSRFCCLCLNEMAEYGLSDEGWRAGTERQVTVRKKHTVWSVPAVRPFSTHTELGWENRRFGPMQYMRRHPHHSCAGRGTKSASRRSDHPKGRWPNPWSWRDRAPFGTRRFSNLRDKYSEICHEIKLDQFGYLPSALRGTARSHSYVLHFGVAMVHGGRDFGSVASHIRTGRVRDW